MHGLISACAGNHSKLSLQQFAEVYTRHKERDIDRLDPARGNEHTILVGCCRLILFRGLSGKRMDREHLMIQEVGIRVRTSF